MKILAQDRVRSLFSRPERLSMTDLTLRAFLSDRAARKLASERLFPPERAIFQRFQGVFENGRVLDLGVGSGRVTGRLLPFCADYLGTDLSPQMLAHAERAHPAGRFLLEDLRNLDELDEAPFDFILIAYNTIDVLEHADRLTFLAAVRKKLKPSGLFVFSSHNRDWIRCGRPSEWPRPTSLFQLPRYGWRLVSAARERLNHRRLAGLQRAEKDYAIVTGSLNRSGLVYCIDSASQQRQLKDAGFDIVAIYDADGVELRAEERARRSYNLHFVCRPGAYSAKAS